MPETDLSTVVILLSACLGVLFLLLMVAVGYSYRLGRIERLLAQKPEAAAGESVPETREAVDARPGGPFDTFLAEDGARKLLTKKEQAAAYRKWRQERGMNWSNS